MTTQPNSRRQISGWRPINKYAGHCDETSCHKQGRFKVMFQDGGWLFLCPRHKENVLSLAEPSRVLPWYKDPVLFSEAEIVANERAINEVR